MQVKAAMDTGEGKRILLHDVKGLGEEFALLDGVDQDGRVWVYRRQSSLRTCSICGQPVKDGWRCLDNGDDACSVHVTISGKLQ